MSIKKLASKKGRVYVYLANKEIGRRFMEDAEREGFTFEDGVKPTERVPDSIMALNRNRTINYVGFVGHMAFGCADSVGGKRLIKIDYRDYINRKKE